MPPIFGGPRIPDLSPLADAITLEKNLLVEICKGGVPSLCRQGLASIAFSQSGQSPDLVAPTAWFSARGACTLAVVNDAASPLAQAAQQVIALHAGPERSVAATKSYIAQLVAGAALVAAWQQDSVFSAAVQALPGQLQAATGCAIAR